MTSEAVVPSCFLKLLGSPKEEIDIVSYSTEPVKLKSSSSEDERVFHIVTVAGQRKWKEETKQNLYKKMLPYIAEAFQEDLQKITPEQSKDHFEHIFEGDEVSLMLQFQQKKHQQEEESEEEEEEENQEVSVVAHLLLSLVPFTLPSSSSSSTSPCVAMCVVGRCVSPCLQNLGIAGKMHEFALSRHRPRAVCSRTINPSILKLIRRTSPLGTKLFPNDCTQQEDWELARNIGIQITKNWDHLAVQLNIYDPNSLAFKNAYSEEFSAIFTKTAGKEEEGAETNNESESNNAPPTSRDAILRVALFPAS